MAYVPEDDEKQEENVAAPESPGPMAPVATGADDAAPPSAPPAASGSGFVNFDQYFSANQAGAERSANQLASGAENAANKAEKGINSATEAIENATGNAHKVSVPRGPLGETQPRSRGSVVARDSGWDRPVDPRIISQAERDMGAVGTTEAEARSRAAARYTGPGSLLDAQFGDLSGDVERAGQRLRSLGSDEGIQAAVGGNALDGALIGRAGQGRFRDLRDRYGSLTNLLVDRNRYATGLADRARTNTARDAGRYQAVLDAWEKDRLAREEEARKKFDDDPRNGGRHYTMTSV